MDADKIVVLDFGAQYAHLIARRIRQLHVFSEILDPSAPLKELRGAKGIILSGGPASVYDKNVPAFNKEIFSLDKPILGLCYGHQLMSKQLGGKVEEGHTREYGLAELEIKKPSRLFAGLSPKETVWMSHGDAVEILPTNFEVIGSTTDCKTAAIADFKRNYFGLQFHPEVTHTLHGMEILKNFVFKVCKCKADWIIENRLEELVQEIKERVGSKKVFMLASGGVDSTVALALLGRALPKEKIFALHVDTGFMRKDESEKIEKYLKELDFCDLKVIDASDKFFNALQGVIHPEKKRKIIGNLFIEILKEGTEKLGLSPEQWILAQGTIYPDTIETAATKHAAKIKTHHNRVPLILELIESGKVVEPLHHLYKDEVRDLGKNLGLPKEIIERHPFPGPALAIRILCSDGKEEMADEAEEKADEICKKFALKAKILPIKSVGVQGDARTYKHPIAIQGEANWETVEKVSTELTNKIKKINRVIHLLTPSEINSVKLLEKTLTKERVSLLRKADAKVEEIVVKNNLLNEIWQFPVVLAPVEINNCSLESIILRPVKSREAMTASFYPMSEKALGEIKKEISKLKVGAIFFDVTHKPPATIEWE